MHNLLESNMDNIFNNWAISEESRPEFEHHQPNNASERTFKNRPGDSEDAAFTPLDRIPHRHFYYYYNTLNDRIVPQLTLPCQAILSVLFRRAHGFNRNWCQMSLPQLERATGASRNTIRKHLKTLIEAGWICIVSDGYHEATTYGMRIPVTINETPAEDHAETPTEIPELDTPIPACVVHRTADGSPDIEDQNPSPQSTDEQAQASDTQEQGVRGSKIARQKLPPCTSSTCTKSKTGVKPGSHPWQYSRDHVRTDLISTGENRVTDNHNDKKYRGSLPSTKPDLEKSYLKSLPKKKVGEIYRAQDAWDEILGPDTQPTAAKLNQMLQYMRGWYRGENLDTKFRWCLADTKKKRPRDAVAWLISALKHGRYPNIVMSKSRWERTGNSSFESRPSRNPSVSNLGKAPDAQPELDGNTSEQIREATAEREKRRAESPHRDVWEKVLKDIREKILPQSYESWFKPLFIAEIGDTAVIFDAPDQMVADWVEQNYIELLKLALKAVGIFDQSISFETSTPSS